MQTRAKNLLLKQPVPGYPTISLHLPSLLILLAAAVFTLPASAADKIEDFLGLKFGATRAAAKEAMLARGSKLKDEKSPDSLAFTDGTYSGEKMTELVLHFAADRFDVATVTVKYSVDKSNEKGLALYETMRKALTEKYGAPATTPSIARGKAFVEKAKGNQLETIWQSKDALAGEHRSIVLTVPGIGMYDWVYKVVYTDHNAVRGTKEPAARKDI